jgi:hypothetical protein
VLKVLVTELRFTIGLVFLASLALNKFVTLPDGIAVDMAVPLLAIQFIQILILPNWIRYKIYSIMISAAKVK